MKKNTLLFITIFFVILTAVLSGCKKNADLSGGTVSDTTVTTGLYDTDFSDVTVSDTTAPIVFYDADFSDVTVSDKTVPTVFYDGEYGDTSDKSELSFTEIKLNYKKTVTVPDNCYIRINENIGRHAVNKTPLCAVLYDKNGKTSIDIDDKRLIALMNFYNIEAPELEGTRFQSQGQIEDDEGIYKDVPRLVITFADPSIKQNDHEILQIVVRNKEYDIIRKTDDNVVNKNYSYNAFSITPYGDIVYFNDNVPEFLKMFGFIE